jgi:hypothetical protein
MTYLDAFFRCIIDFRINNGTGIGTALNPLTFILSPEFGGEGRVRGA